jgi:TetR/AcrR family transcriptional regulator, transcriptional repressor for nem operon
MRYEKGHKDATRQHILDVASAQFREGGVAAVGIAGIMTGAGLTNGAFYNHFESKEDLVEAVLANALGGRRIGLRANLEAGKSLDVTIRDYLSARHRDDASGGCPTAALVAEIARHPKTTRHAFTAKIQEIVDLIAVRAGEGSARERRKRAIAVYGLMVGALQLARAVNDRKLSDEILECAADSALTIATETDELR